MTPPDDRPTARVHPSTMVSRGIPPEADTFEIFGIDYRLVQSESVEMGRVLLEDGTSVGMEPVSN